VQSGSPEPAESEPAESEPAESEPAESEPAESEPAESEPAEQPAVGQPPSPPATLLWRTSLLLVSAFFTVLLSSVTMLVPAPYVVLRPGPVINTLGKEGGHDLITVRGHPIYPAKGALDLTTVTVRGGPGTRLSMYPVIVGWFDPVRLVVPRDVLYVPGETAEKSQAENQEEMVSSQESATVAALRELGITVPETLTVYSVDSGTPPSTLRADDVILAVNEQPIVDLSTLESLLRQVRAGDSVRVTVRRSGARTTVVAPTRRSKDGRTILGIRVGPSFKPPFEVTIRIANVGGPSAGMMFALGIIDVLTPGDMTGGAQIAGTGTITEKGEVGSIGGVQQKLVGARAAGAQWFLVPADNCKDTVGHMPAGLRAASVRDLHDARLAVERIGSGRISELTSCPSSGPRGQSRP
jgi:PDZ domain-containing protein